MPPTTASLDLQLKTDPGLAFQNGRAVSGMSLLTTTSNLLHLEQPFNYRGYRTLMAFAEAYVFHDGITIVGSPEAEIRRGDYAYERWRRFGELMDRLDHHRPGVVAFSDGEALKQRGDIGQLLATYSRAVLGRETTIEDLLPKAPPGRYGEDAEALLSTLPGVLRAADSSAMREGLRDVIAAQREGSNWTSIGPRLQRALLYAAVARSIGGSLILTGSREAVGLLLALTDEVDLPETTALRTYRAADAVSIEQQAPSPAQLGQAFHTSLLEGAILRRFQYLPPDWRERDPTLRLNMFLDVLNARRDGHSALLRYGRDLDRGAAGLASVKDRKILFKLEEKAVALARAEGLTRGDRFEAKLRKVFGRQQTVDGTLGAPEGDGRLGLLIQLAVNAVGFFYPEHSERRVALRGLKQLIIEAFERPSKCTVAFDVFGIPTATYKGHRAARNPSEIEALNALDFASARVRLRGLDALGPNS